MYQPSENLNDIVTLGTDLNCVVEFYADTQEPPFDASEAVLRYSNVEGLSVFGEEYQKLVTSFGRVKRTSKKDKNSFSVTIDNLNRDAADFELSGGGFEGKVMVVRLVSRSRTVLATDSLIFFVGRCLKPKDGSKQSMTIEAEQIFGSLAPEIPRRKYSPHDAKGRARTDMNFEGFPYLPAYGTTIYKRRKSYLFGLIKKTVEARLQWSSVNPIDTNKDLPETFGRVQILGSHLGYADIGTQIKSITAFCEGPIKEWLRIISTDFRFVQFGTLHKRFGYPPNVSPPAPNAIYTQIPIPDTGWPSNAYYANTVWLGAHWNGTSVAQTDPAPDIAVLMLAKIVKILDSSDEFTVDEWSDNPAAVVRWALLSDYYENLTQGWLNDASFVEAYKFNNEFLFDTSFSDLIFVPTGFYEENLETSGALLPTSSVTTDYFKYLADTSEAGNAFNKQPVVNEYDSLVPIDPDDFPDDPNDPPNINVSVFLRRRYTFNGIVNKKQKLWDWLNEAVLPASRMFLTQGFDGKIHLKHKKPADFAIGTAAFAEGATVLALDDVSRWIATLRGSLLVQPHSDISEVRTVSAANYSAAQNSVALSASANITVTPFAGCDGSETPATALLTMDSVNIDPDINSITLDGESIAVYANEFDTVESLAGFFFGSINAHPRLRQKFTAAWTPGTDEVTITAKFGTLTLSSALSFDHPAPLANPTTAPTIAATASGSLAAGGYRVAYAYENANGRTLCSAVQSVILTDGQKITVSAVTPPAGVTSVIWYTSPEPYSNKLREHSTNDGSGFVIDSLPTLNAALVNTINRTGTEVLRVEHVFSDQGSIRTNRASANVLKDSYKFILGRREESTNAAWIEFNDATQDFRLVQVKLRDEEHIAKVKKENKVEIDGSGIDSFNQAYRVISGVLAEQRDADFFYRNESDREALFLEEGDVVCVSDTGAGVVNLPVRIEDIEYDDLAKGLPRAQFVMRAYSSTLYDDSVAEREIPVIQSADEPPARLVADAVFREDTTGPILIDRTTGIPYRLFVDAGVLDIEEADLSDPTVPDAFALDFEILPTDTTIGLKWFASNDDYGVKEYVIQFATDDIFTTGTGSQVFPATVPYLEDEAGIVTGLTPSTTYWFRIKARDHTGNESAWTTHEITTSTEA